MGELHAQRSSYSKEQHMSAACTQVDQHLLLRAAYAADSTPERLPENRDFYLVIVASAVGLTFDEVKKRFNEGDEGILRARMFLKCILFQRTYGVQPRSVCWCRPRSTCG